MGIFFVTFKNVKSLLYYLKHCNVNYMFYTFELLSFITELLISSPMKKELSKEDYLIII